MSADGKRSEPINVVLCWHMHQPQYRDLVSGEYALPWTYLHAIKDYVDMAAHLEAEPGARAVVNFAPILLEQISDYAAQVQGWLRDGKAIRDPLLEALVNPALPKETGARESLIRACLRANEERLIKRFPAYQRLVRLARWMLKRPDMLRYLDDQFLVDLVVWYHIAWMAESVRRENVFLRSLEEKEGCYSVQDRRELLALIGELLSGVLGRYRALAEAGRVELAVSPYAHPILPLLQDLGSAREAMPDVVLPETEAYPGGEARAQWHLTEAVETFQRYFGFKPEGCWPSEGSVSAPTLRLLSDHGFRWAASGETVLFNSAARSPELRGLGRETLLYRPYRIEDSDTACFFRDDGLSDLIGFTYSDWHADDAVANLMHHLENIADHAKDPAETVVSIILDGENAWEYYPENGWYFLSALYRGVSENPRIRLTTFSEALGRVTPKPLPELVAGSWVYGTFSTWIGDADKNRGWEMLVDAKRAFDQAEKSHLDGERLLAARHQLSICEGSDWFWWFGDYNPADTVSDFDRLYRQHLSNLYQLLGRAAPDYLAHAFSHGTGTPEKGGVMRHGQAGG